MRISRNKKKNSTWERRDERLKQRAASEPLRAVCPDAELVSVELEFKTQAPVSHARQVHALYPPAKAHFVYACPYGDCDGAYDLQSIALGALERKGKRVSGSLKCTGNRSREGAASVPCLLEVSYSIVARYEVAQSGGAGVTGRKVKAAAL